MTVCGTAVCVLWLWHYHFLKHFFFFKQTLGLYFSCVVSRQFNEFVLACAALHTREAYTKGVPEESALSFLIFHQAHLYFCSNVSSSLTLTFALDFKSFDSRFKVFLSHRKQLLKKRKWACCYFKMMSVWHSTPPVVVPVVVCYLRPRGCCAVKATRSAAVNSNMGVWHDCRHGAR